MENESPDGTQIIKCPFCFGKGEILVDDERSRRWAFEVRQRAFSEMTKAGVSQELFANTALACHQAHLSRLLSGVTRPDAKLDGRREADLRQIEGFLLLPKRTRQDIYEHVASDPEGFLLAAKLHARLLQEDTAVPGVSQLARAVLERFAAQVTLYPGETEVAVLAGTLQLAPTLVRAFFKERARMLRSFDSQPLEPPFKVPTRIKASKSTLPDKENVMVPKIQVISKLPLTVQSVQKVSRDVEKVALPLQSALKTPLTEENTKVPLPCAKRKARPPLREVTTFTLRVPLPSDLAEAPATLQNEDASSSLIAAIEADSPLPLQADLDKLEPPAASTPTPWATAEGMESEESFVRGLLAHPPPDLASMTPIAMQEPRTPLPLEQFPSSPLKTPVRGLSRAEDDDY